MDESCDKCGCDTDGDEIYLERISMVLCAECYDEHKGIEVYWS